MAPDLDPDLVLATLSETEREVVGAWVEVFGLEADEWVRVRGLRTTLETLAALRHSAHYRQVDDAAMRIQLATEDLGADEGDGRIRNAILRRLYTWLAGPGVADLIKTQTDRRGSG